MESESRRVTSRRVVAQGGERTASSRRVDPICLIVSQFNTSYGTTYVRLYIYKYISRTYI